MKVQDRVLSKETQARLKKTNDSSTNSDDDDEFNPTLAAMETENKAQGFKNS